MKVCIKCGEEKPDKLFAKRENRCKPCKSAYDKTRWLAIREERLALDKINRDATKKYSEIARIVIGEATDPELIEVQTEMPLLKKEPDVPYPEPYRYYGNMTAVGKLRDGDIWQIDTPELVLTGGKTDGKLHLLGGMIKNLNFKIKVIGKTGKPDDRQN